MDYLTELNADDTECLHISARNRIIAALASLTSRRGGMKSGALITAGERKAGAHIGAVKGTSPEQSAEQCSWGTRARHRVGRKTPGAVS